jgi:hypothetical protein
MANCAKGKNHLYLNQVRKKLTPYQTENMEIFFIIIIILAQAYFFYLTWRKIEILKNIFEDKTKYKIIRVTLLQSDLETVEPSALLESIWIYEQRASENSDQPSLSLGLLNNYNENIISATIIRSINTYLLRNSGAVSDFNLIRDIAERNSEAMDEEINSTLSIPLYLGLLGTLLGIVFGLSHISGLSFEGSAESSNVLLDHAIPVLLDGVKVAMIASFIGLLLTVLHSGVFYRLAKAQNERRKNAFYTFIQVELLPLLNENLNTTLYSLQANLLTFNRDFGMNIQRLDGLMNKNYDALMAQEHFMDKLSQIDIAEFATANVKVLNGLKTAVKSFGDFNEYVGAVNLALQKTDNVIISLNQFLDRTDNLNGVTQKLLNVFEQNQELMAFISSHFAALDSSKQMIGTAVVNVNEYLGKAIDDLKIFTEEKIAAIRTIAINEASLMKDTYPEKWNNLDELKKMNQIVGFLSASKDSNASEMRTIHESLYELKSTMEILGKGIDVRVKVPSIKKIVTALFKKEMAHEKI